MNKAFFTNIMIISTVTKYDYLNLKSLVAAMALITFKTHPTRWQVVIIIISQSDSTGSGKEVPSIF